MRKVIFILNFCILGLLIYELLKDIYKFFSNMIYTRMVITYMIDKKISHPKYVFNKVLSPIIYSR